MCGFLGEFVFEGQLSTRVTFEMLLELSKHRGPDHTQITQHQSFQLGFNRLAILDLSSNGNQPILSPSGRYHVVFNGEIYNFKDLAETYHLKALRSTSDTEVLIHLLDQLGIAKTLDVLNGMFAIAIVDTKTKIISLIRDFAGIKPLFYGLNPKGLVFASQFNQVFKHPWYKDQLRLRKDIVKEYFGFGYMPAPNTIFEDILQVRPGELIQITEDGTITTSNYCHFSDKLNIDSIAKDLDFKDILNRAIKRQLISDVPLGTFLSGGIDSPLISALAKLHNPRIEAFTYAAGVGPLDESEQAKSYADHIHIKQHIETLKNEEVLESIESHFNGLPEPFGDYSSIPTYVIAKLAKKQHTVMLSGDGGDELFFGYPRMLHLWKKRYWFYVPWRLRRPLIRLMIKLRLETSWGPYFYKKWSQWVFSKQQYISKLNLENILPNIDYSEEHGNLYDYKHKFNSSNTLQWLRYNEFYGHLQRVLIKVDRMSMANSLEVRVPFLDKEVISGAWDVLPTIKGTTFELKEVLKNTLKNYYPEAMIKNEKKGFSSPIDTWLRGALKDDLSKTVLKGPIFGNDFIDTEALKRYVQNFLDEMHNEAWGVWHIYAWQKWAKKEGLL